MPFKGLGRSETETREILGGTTSFPLQHWVIGLQMPSRQINDILPKVKVKDELLLAKPAHVVGHLERRPFLCVGQFKIAVSDTFEPRPIQDVAISFEHHLTYQ